MRKRAILMMADPYSQSRLESKVKTKPGLYANIQAKRARIAAGSGEKMNKVGSKAAPSAADFKLAAKTAKKPKSKK
jgi:hypothetical protein